MKKALESYPNVVEKVQIQELSIQLMKMEHTNGDPPLCDQLTSTNQGILMTDTVNDGILKKIRDNLNQTGIPIESIQPSSENYKEQFLVEFKAHQGNDIVNMCDSFHLAKMIIKLTCVQNNYDVSFIPNNGEHTPNHLNLLIDTNTEL